MEKPKTVEELLYNIVYDACKERIIQIIKEEEGNIREIVKSIITEDEVEGMIRDIFTFDSDVSEMVKEIVLKTVGDRLSTVLGGTNEK